jgi:hypothetical protein
MLYQTTMLEECNTMLANTQPRTRLWVFLMRVKPLIEQHEDLPNPLEDNDHDDS